MTVQDKDKGWKKIKAAVKKANKKGVAVGLLGGDTNAEGELIAEYGAYNEFGTADIPSRPFMGTAFDENVSGITKDFAQESKKILELKKSPESALSTIGRAQEKRIKDTIQKRDFLPALSPATVRAKGSTKTLIDTGAMVSSVKIQLRPIK